MRPNRVVLDVENRRAYVVKDMRVMAKLKTDPAPVSNYFSDEIEAMRQRSIELEKIAVSFAHIDQLTSDIVAARTRLEDGGMKLREIENKLALTSEQRKILRTIPAPVITHAPDDDSSAHEVRTME